MPTTRRLSNASKEAFTEFCSKNQPLSRRLSRNSDETSIDSESQWDSITKDRGNRVLKRRNQSCNRAKGKKGLSSGEKGPTNFSSPATKKRRTSTRKSQTNEDKENDVVDDRNVGCPMMSPTPYWKVCQ